MPVPLAYLAGAGLMAGGALYGARANWYSQAKQRDLYRYQKAGYERAFRDWNKNVPGRYIKYPEFSYPGHIRALDTGISQSLASSAGTTARLVGQFGGGLTYGRTVARSLYGQSSGRTSRWL